MKSTAQQFNTRNSKRQIDIRAIGWVVFLAVLPLLVLAKTTRPEVQNEVAGPDLRQPQIAVEVADAPTLEVQLASLITFLNAEPDDAVLEQGRRAYRASCAHCHGYEPEGLDATVIKAFGQAVMQGRGEMPSLEFKMEWTEVEAIRRYVNACANDDMAC